MLPKSIRVDKNLFDELKKVKPKTVQKENFFTLKYYQYTSKHFAVVISKKVIKKASKRVKIKRVFKRCLQKSVANCTAGVYVFVITSPAVIDTSYEEICSKINSTLSKVS